MHSLYSSFHCKAEKFERPLFSTCTLEVLPHVGMELLVLLFTAVAPHPVAWHYQNESDAILSAPTLEILMRSRLSLHFSHKCSVFLETSCVVLGGISGSKAPQLLNTCLT